MLRNVTLVVLALCLGLTCNLTPALADPSIGQRYGLEFRGSFNMYDMGDVNAGAEYMQREANGTLTTGDSGPGGGISGLFRPSAHQLWEFGYNALFDVENLVEGRHPDTTGQILMHANEFFLKASGVILLSDRIHLDLGAGLSFYNVELQIQDEFGSRFNYDAVARCFGLNGGANLELLFSNHAGLVLGGGGRFANATDFSQESTTGVRSALPVLGGSRPMEVNMSGMYGQLGLRLYFDKVTKPVDFGR